MGGWRMGSVWCNQRIYIGLLLFSTITWMFLSFYRFNATTIPTFFEENKKCLEGRTAGLDARQLWLSFHTIVNECSSKNYLVYRRHLNDELDVDHVVANAENWDCTIASYGLSQSSSVELHLSEEAPYCQLYGIGSDKRKGDAFTKVGEYFEAKELENQGGADDRQRSEKRKREANYTDNEGPEINNKRKFTEKDQKIEKLQATGGMYVLENPFEEDKTTMKEVVSALIEQEGEQQTRRENEDRRKDARQNKANLQKRRKEKFKLDSDDKKDDGDERERDDKELQMSGNHHQIQTSSPKTNSFLPEVFENDEELRKEDQEGGRKINATINWQVQPKEKPKAKKTGRKLAKNKAVEAEETGPDEVPESEEKAFNRKLKKERKAKKESANIQGKHAENANSRRISDTEGDVRTKFVMERAGDIEEGTEGKKTDVDPKSTEEKVDKRAEYLIKHNAGPDNEETGEDRQDDRKEIEHILEQKREAVSKWKGTSTTSEPFSTEKSTTSKPDAEDDTNTTLRFDADNETIRELGGEKNMIEDDKDYVVPSTASVDSVDHSSVDVHKELPQKGKRRRKVLNVDVETYLLKHVKRQMIYQLSVNVENGFEVLSALTSRSLRSIDICQINIILHKPSKKDLEHFASFYKYSVKSMGLLPLVVDLIDEDMRIYFINTSSPTCLNLYLFSSGKPSG